MLKELFEGTFYITYPKLSEKVLLLNEWTRSGNFFLTDESACRECEHVCCDLPNEREQMKVTADAPVNIISIDQVVSYVKEDIGKSCDYMLDDSNMIALVELTCSKTEYVVNKRQTARRQLYNSLCVLYVNPRIKEHIEKHPVRYVVFSWKDSFRNTHELDKVEVGMKGMTMMPDLVYSPDNESKFDFDFKLKEIRYPHPFVFK